MKYGDSLDWKKKHLCIEQYIENTHREDESHTHSCISQLKTDLNSESYPL